MPNIDLSVNTGQTKQLTFNCANTYMPEDIVFNITASGGDANTTLSGVAYCSTAASTQAKTATMPGFALSPGQRIILYLSTTNSKASATLNVNSTGAKTIRIGGANTTTSNFTAGYWICNYDGTYWVAEKMNNSKLANGAGYTTNTGTVTSIGITNGGGLTITGSPVTTSGTITVGHTNSVTAGTNVGNNSTTNLSHGGTFTVPYFSYDTNGHITVASTKTLKLPGSGNTDNYGTVYVQTAASTAAKTATVPWQYTLRNGNMFILYLKTTNSSTSATLNINSTGAKSVRINGASPTSSNWASGTYLCYYDGTYYQMYTNRNPFADSYTGTVTSVGLTNATNGGLTISSSPITSSGSITVGHSNVLSSAQSTQAVYPITIDKNGHIGSYGTAVTIPTISGTNDGTNWTSLTINGTTKNIPSGGSGSVTYLSDLGDVYTSPDENQFLGYNGSEWTGMFAAKTVNAGSGLNTTSGDTTVDGGYIGFGTNNGSDASVPTGTLHLTRVNTASGYDNAKLSFGPTGNITVTSSSNTFKVPYYMVDKFGRVTSSKSRTITIDGLGGGSSNVSATASEDTTLGYFAGSINIDGTNTNFVVSPARITESGVRLSRQGVVRPHYEIDTSEWSNTSYLELGSRLGSISSLNVASLDKTITKGCFLPITVIYRFNTTTQKYESIPGIIINSLENPFVGYSVDNTTIITS